METLLDEELNTSHVVTGPPRDGKPVRTALLGWSLEAMESLDTAGRRFVSVVPPEFEHYMREHEIPFVCWSFEKINHHSDLLYKVLAEMGVELAVPLYEETVEWAGAVNSRFREKPKLFNRALLLRDKAMMKRKAQMSGIRVGVFEEVDGREQVGRFLRRVQDILVETDEGQDADLVHLKPLTAAGSVGHRVIRNEEDVWSIPDDTFPCLVESHLNGQEFSVEAFIHAGKVRFMNVTEYVRLGHSNFVPAGPKLMEYRAEILAAIQKLVDAFGVEYGMIHPEYFVDSRGVLHFGEVAARIPGGHIFELIQKAWGFDPYLGFVLCSDPETSEEELEAYFPAMDAQPRTRAGCLMVYPKTRVVNALAVPETLLDEPYFEKHNLFEPVTAKVRERVGFGNHYGTVYFQGDDPQHMRGLLEEWEKADFYE